MKQKIFTIIENAFYAFFIIIDLLLSLLVEEFRNFDYFIGVTSTILIVIPFLLLLFEMFRMMFDKNYIYNTNVMIYRVLYVVCGVFLVTFGLKLKDYFVKYYIWFYLATLVGIILPPLVGYILYKNTKNKKKEVPNIVKNR